MIVKKIIVLIFILAIQAKPMNMMPDIIRSEYEKTSQELAQIKQAEERIRRPPLFSKDYWLSRNREKKIYEKLMNNQDPSQFAAELGKPTTEDDRQELERVEGRLETIKQYVAKEGGGGIKETPKLTSITPKTLKSYYDYTWFQNQLKKYYVLSWDNLAYGLTIKEVEKVLLILCFIRFCIYTVKYDIKTSLIICLIGLVSAFLYEMILTDCIAICFERIYLNSSLFRFAFEEYLEKVKAEMPNTDPPGTLVTTYRWILNNWVLAFIQKLPAGEAITDYITSTFLPFCSNIVRMYRNSVRAMLLYTMVLRLGKKYIPYHIQWHLMLYVLYTQFGKNFWQIYENSNEFLNDVLIPELRFEEIEFMELMHSTFIGMATYLTLLAMLHALFSQYYYVPFLVPNVEAHIGKRPKKSIYSGGYTSWQDEQELFVSTPADWKIWFGFLGKGPNDRKQRKKRRKDRPK